MCTFWEAYENPFALKVLPMTLVYTLKKLVGRVGLEPTTNGLKVQCSTT